MTFTYALEIDPRVTQRDVALALRRAAAMLEKKPTSTFEDGDKQPIRDTSGEIIGEWNVSK